MFFFTTRLFFVVVAVVCLETVAGSVQTVSASSIIAINELLAYLYVIAGQPSTSTVLLLYAIPSTSEVYSHVDRTAENEYCTRRYAIMYTCAYTHMYMYIMFRQRHTGMSTCTVLPTNL